VPPAKFANLRKPVTIHTELGKSFEILRSLWKEY